MKKITMTFALIVAMMAQSCQKEDLSEVTSEQDFDAAYISLTINSSATRAADSESDDGTTEVGTTAENKISSLALLAFDTNYDYIDAYSVSVYENSKFICEVAPDSRRFFAVVNPTTEIWKAIDGVASFSQSAFSSLDAIVMTAASASTGNDNGFVMVNCGAKNTNGILLESLVTINATSLGTTEDTATALTINVDRLVSKFQYSVSTSLSLSDNNAKGQIDGVALTATNKASYLYSMIYLDNLTGKNVYRTDHNMSVGKLEGDIDEANEVIAALEANFNWLKNGSGTTDAAFVAPDDAATSPEYVLENTCEPSYSNSNNLTQAIVKAQYNPVMSSGTALALGTSWFKMYTSSGDGTLYLTFAEVVSLYNGGTVYDFTADDDTKTSMDKQLDNILGTTGNSWASVTLATLDACTYGGYKAATVASEDDYVLQYYQKAVNYYDIFIQHDDAIDVGHAGRWGMVRNNSYTMAITGISKEGLPYIPDPTDSAIVDPENQDPMDPEPADKLDAYIAVSITVNPWVLWYQESVLE